MWCVSSKLRGFNGSPACLRAGSYPHASQIRVPVLRRFQARRSASQAARRRIFSFRSPSMPSSGEDMSRSMCRCMSSGTELSSAIAISSSTAIQAFAAARLVISRDAMEVCSSLLRGRRFADKCLIRRSYPAWPSTSLASGLAAMSHDSTIGKATDQQHLPPLSSQQS